MELGCFGSAEIRDDILRPLVGLGEQDLAGSTPIYEPAKFGQEIVRLLQVFADCAFTLIQIRDGVASKPIKSR